MMRMKDIGIQLALNVKGILKAELEGRGRLMISLKLAEYNKEGKFKRFLNCGIEDRQFLFGDKVIRINGLCEEDYYKDEKDPLNRFNGRFDGITYGEGRFVLIINDNPIIMDKIINS
jgi:hypothetical protein